MSDRRHSPFPDPLRAIVDDFGVERTYRRCPHCTRWLWLTTANFSVRRRDPETRAVLRYYPICHPCQAAACRARWASLDKEARQAASRRDYENRKADPERAEQMREQMREAAKRYRERNPSYQAEQNRRYRERVRKDPERLARLQETQRLGYRLREVRAGRSLDSFRRSPVEPPKPSGKTGALPSDPLLARIDAWHAEQRALDEGAYRIVGATLDNLAELAGVSVRSISRMRTSGRVSYDVADRFAVALGTHVALIYSDELEEAA